jgi:RNA polymerase sigma factor (sigma-70 family)
MASAAGSARMHRLVTMDGTAARSRSLASARRDMPALAGSGSLAAAFEEQRPRLCAVAYRMLGSLAEAEDAVQDAWLRLSRTGDGEIENLGGWLTTVVARLCLNMLQARQARREDLAGVHLPDPVIAPDEEDGPEQQALLTDSVGLALLVVLDTLAPAQRLAFVLHDIFGVAFSDVAVIAGRSPGAVKQLASRARHRVRAATVPAPDASLARQRQVVDAFFAASRRGDLDALVAVLDPEVVLRSDHGAARPWASGVRRGAVPVARQALTFSRLAPFARPAVVNGTAGAVVAPRGRLFSVLSFTVTRGRICEINVIADPERLRHLRPAVAGR